MNTNIFSLVASTLTWFILLCPFQGHDCCPYLFTYTGPHALECVKKLDIPKQTSKGSLSAMQHFRNLDKKATEEDNNELETLHQNSIM